MIDEKMKQNAHKVTFIIEQYPKHTLEEVIKLIQLPAIDINTAIWAAGELGYIKSPKGEKDAMSIKTLPATWDFGPDVAHLAKTLLYAFRQLAKEEADLEEVYLSNWTLGYASHDVLIALKGLIAQKELATYEVTDIDEEGAENVYTFYSLYDNAEQQWGRKQFKVPPA